MFKLAIFLRSDNVSLNPFHSDQISSFVRDGVVLTTRAMYDMIDFPSVRHLVVISDAPIDNAIVVADIKGAISYLSANHTKQHWWMIVDNRSANEWIWKGLVMDVHLAKCYISRASSAWASLPALDQSVMFDRDLLDRDDMAFAMASSARCPYQERYTMRHYLRRNVEENTLLNAMHETVVGGMIRPNRTGVDTYSLFGKQFEYVMQERIDPETGKSSFRLPLLTTKRMFTRGIFAELKWFLSGGTDSKELEAQRVNIWKGNTSRAFLDATGHQDYSEGETGPIYGFQWKHWGAEYVPGKRDYSGEGIDQVHRIIESLQSDPYSRRHVISGWNVSDLNKMCLPPCFPANTMVLTENGYKAIQDLLDEDLVYTHRGNWKPILNRQERTYAGDIYSIRSESSSIAIRATDEHPFLVKPVGESKTIWVKAKDLSAESHMLCVPICTTETTNDLNIDWSSVGAIVGSGSGLCTWPILTAFTTDQSIFNVIPEWVQSLPTRILLQFVYGFESSTSDTVIRVQNEGMALSLQRIYAKLKIFAAIKVYDDGTVRLHKTFNPDVLFDSDYMYVPIRSIESAEQELPVFNIEVADDNSYVVENIATHNCHMLYQFMVHEANDQKYLSLMMTQRSNDVFLGLPFNVCSLGMFLMMMAHRVGMKPHKIIHSIADFHIYKNHTDAVMRQIEREPCMFPYISIHCDPKDRLEDYNFSDLLIEDYHSHGPIKADMVA